MEESRSWREDWREETEEEREAAISYGDVYKHQIGKRGTRVVFINDSAPRSDSNLDTFRFLLVASTFFTPHLTPLQSITIPHHVPPWKEVPGAIR